jgi:hypothetical protein
MNPQGQEGGTMQVDSSSSEVHVIELPSSTPWPMVLALGIALVLTGMVTSGFVSLLGLLLAIMGSIGWFRQVLPHEVHDSVPVLRRGDSNCQHPNHRETSAHERRCTARSSDRDRFRSQPASRAVSPAALR